MDLFHFKRESRKKGMKLNQANESSLQTILVCLKKKNFIWFFFHFVKCWFFLGFSPNIFAIRIYCLCPPFSLSVHNQSIVHLAPNPADCSNQTGQNSSSCNFIICSICCYHTSWVSPFLYLIFTIMASAYLHSRRRPRVCLMRTARQPLAKKNTAEYCTSKTFPRACKPEESR